MNKTLTTENRLDFMFTLSESEIDDLVSQSVIAPSKVLGNKICIIGCSSSGKSTLGDMLSKKLNIPVVHLDLLAHDYDTNWRRKSDSELIKLHNQVLEKDCWIIEGNYSVCMKERFSMATAVIWLDFNVLTSVVRYIKRCASGDKNRVGKLPGSSKEFSFWLLKHILFVYPKNRAKYQKILESISVPIIKIESMKRLEEAKRIWRL